MKAKWLAVFAVALAACSGGSAGSEPDGGSPDSGVDAGPDAGTPDGGHPDAGHPDAGHPDAGHPDAGQPDAGSDAGTPDSGTPDSGTVTPTVGGIFEQPEPWTEDVSGLTKSASSDAIIGELNTLGGWGMGNSMQIDFSIPLFFANSQTPRQTITANTASGTYCYGGPDCDAVPLQMPLPSNGNTEGSSTYTCDTSYNTDGQGDCHVLVVETDQKILYELYNSTKTSDGFVALGAFKWDLTYAYPDNLRGDQCTSADAAGMPIAALLPTSDDVAAGEVKHAIRFILPNPHMRKGYYVHPATHAGAPSSTNANAPPYGVRFRLKASYDVSGFSAGEQVILAAMKKYGMILSDGGQDALTFADDRLSTNKWSALGVSGTSFTSLHVTDFEVVDLGSYIAQTDDCVRN